MEPGLYIVGTPIGNLSDMTYRAVETLNSMDVIYAEDTRHSGILLKHYDITAPMVSCHKFNESYRSERAVERIRNGSCAALITDSGMPGISDPGGRLVAACRKAGLHVTIVPGPSAVTTAVALSGYPCRGFHFEGFLPQKGAARERRLQELGDCELPVVFYESPFRLLKLLTETERVLGNRYLCVAREMTKKFEECRTGSARELSAYWEDRKVKGELVVILFPDNKHSQRFFADAIDTGGTG